MNTTELRQYLRRFKNKNYEKQIEYVNRAKTETNKLDLNMFVDSDFKQELIDAVNRINKYQVPEYVEVSEEVVINITRIVNRIFEMDEEIANFTKQ